MLSKCHSFYAIWLLLVIQKESKWCRRPWGPLNSPITDKWLEWKRFSSFVCNFRIRRMCILATKIYGSLSCMNLTPFCNLEPALPARFNDLVLWPWEQRKHRNQLTRTIFRNGGWQIQFGLLKQYIVEHYSDNSLPSMDGNVQADGHVVLQQCRFNVHFAVQTGHSSEGQFSRASLPIFCSHVNALWVSNSLWTVCIFWCTLHRGYVMRIPFYALALFIAICAPWNRPSDYCGLVGFQWNNRTWQQNVLFSHSWKMGFLLAQVTATETLILSLPVVHNAYFYQVFA